MKADINAISAGNADDVLIHQVIRYVVHPQIRPDYTEEVPELPDFVRLIIWCNVLELEISNSGIGLLIDRYGSDLNQMLSVFRRFQCILATEYLGKAQAQFPQGEIPLDEDERWDCLEKLELKLRELDRNYDQAVIDTARRLRQVMQGDAELCNRQIQEFWSKFGR